MYLTYNKIGLAEVVGLEQPTLIKVMQPAARASQYVA